MGSTGDPPVPVGDPPTGTSKATPKDSAVLISRRCPAHSVRRVAGRHRPVACATQLSISKHALSGFAKDSDPSYVRSYKNSRLLTAVRQPLIAPYSACFVLHRA